jgi:hypothetical protein
MSSPQRDFSLKLGHQFSSQAKSYTGLLFILSPASVFPYTFAEVSAGACLERPPGFPLP